MRCKQPIKIGSTFGITLQRTSHGEPFPINNTIVESSVRHKKFGKFEMSANVIDGDQGIVRLEISAEETLKMLPGDYIWDIIFIDQTGKVEIFPKEEEAMIFTFIKGATR